MNSSALVLTTDCDTTVRIVGNQSSQSFNHLVKLKMGVDIGNNNDNIFCDKIS